MGADMQRRQFIRLVGGAVNVSDVVKKAAAIWQCQGVGMTWFVVYPTRAD